jgi:uncharacterized membrane protein YidH (DUF202 family)
MNHPLANSGREPPEDTDVPGLAAERTDLAWSRTTLAMAVIAAAVLRRIWSQFETVTARVVLLSVLAAVGVGWLVGIWWSVTVGHATLEGRPVATPKVLRRLTDATVILSVMALVLSLVPYRT